MIRSGLSSHEVGRLFLKWSGLSSHFEYDSTSAPKLVQRSFAVVRCLAPSELTVPENAERRSGARSPGPHFAPTSPGARSKWRIDSATASENCRNQCKAEGPDLGFSWSSGGPYTVRQLQEPSGFVGCFKLTVNSPSTT
jgi:hypothetical protein